MRPPVSRNSKTRLRKSDEYLIREQSNRFQKSCKLISIIHHKKDSKVWKIGKEYVQGTRKIIARADFLADVVYENNLEVVAHTQVHELHANIKPLPLDRADRDEILRELALASDLEIMPPEDT